MTDWVTVMTFTYPHEVALIQGYLEAEGVTCFVRDQMTVQINNLYSNAVGGIRLQVPAPEVEHALEVLRDGGFLTPVPSAAAVDQTEGVGLCPVCMSDNISPRRLSAAPFAAAYLFGIPLILPWHSRRRHCFECGADFRTKKAAK